MEHSQSMKDLLVRYVEATDSGGGSEFLRELPSGDLALAWQGLQQMAQAAHDEGMRRSREGYWNGVVPS